jgi:hypothetical protein
MANKATGIILPLHCSAIFIKRFFYFRFCEKILLKNVRLDVSKKMSFWVTLNPRVYRGKTINFFYISSPRYLKQKQSELSITPVS